MKSYFGFGICALSLLCVSLVIGGPIKRAVPEPETTKELNVLLTEALEKIPQSSLDMIENIMGEMKAVQMGEMAMPPNDLVVSMGFARYIHKIKLVNIKDYQEGKKGVKEFFQEAKPMEDAIYDAAKELFLFLKAYKEEEANELSKKWFVYGSYLKVYALASSRITSNAHDVFLTLPDEL